MEFVWIPPGEFVMGSPLREVGRYKDETQHKVVCTRGFWMGKYEVTQEQWKRMGGTNVSRFKGARLPVDLVSWDDCRALLMKLNQRQEIRNQVQGKTIRLPTEAEWEYACRAGTQTRFCSGDTETDLDRVGWYEGNSEKTPHPVGQKAPNAWGLFDMHGNVSEWCLDSYWWYEATVQDPLSWNVNAKHVDRGGSWFCNAEVCRSADRRCLLLSARRPGLGCRFVLSERVLP
jgi:formylglycine-generating enzyme required for sulfatase activity